MSRFRTFVLVTSLISMSVYAANLSTASASPSAVGLKDTFGYTVDGAGQEGDFAAQYQEDFVAPRAFPKTQIDVAARYREYLKLHETRRLLRMPHINAGFAEGPEGDGTTSKNDGGITPFSVGGRGANGLAWRSVGPTNVNGRVTKIAIDPNNHKRLFVATVGGVWRSTDEARTWQCVSDDFLSQVFASVAIEPDSAEIIAGTGDPDYQGANGIGIWRSTSSGNLGSWVKVSPPELDYQVIYRLRYDPKAPYDIYAATSAGVYKGTHTSSGISWARLGGFDANASDMVVDFSVSPRLVYAGVYAASTTYSQGLWKYDGTTWSERDSGIPISKASVWSLAIAQSAPGTIYAKISQSGGHLLDVYKTTTGGEQSGGVNGWKALGASELDDSCATTSSGKFCYSWYNNVIEVDPTDANTVYAGGLNPWLTTTGGTSWTKVAQGTDTTYPLSVHSDHHAFAYDPSNHNIVYAGDDGGLFRSTDSSTKWHWNDVSHGMIVTQFYHGLTSQQTATLFAGGSQDNGTEITFGNRTWYPPGGCDGSNVAIDSADTDTLYAECNGGLYEFTNPVPGTTGGGNHITWTVPSGLTLKKPLVTNPAVAHFSVSSALDGSKVYHIVKTADNVTWTDTTALPVGGQITALASAPSSKKVIYAGLDTPTIIHSIDGGGSWVTTTSGLTTNLRPNAIAVDFSDEKRAFAAFGGSAGAAIYLTTDGGKTWFDISGTGATAIPNVPLTGVVIDPSDPNTIYVSSTIGVFKGTVSGTPPTASWVAFDEGIPDGIDVNDIAVNNATKTLSISTFGHGAYERDINPADSGGAAITVVRDEVLDTGIGASDFSGTPDPEHPVKDTTRPKFYEPNNSPGGVLAWWESPDIRADVPSDDPVPNKIASADSVEMETCPVEISGCPPGVMIDSNPKQGKPANIYVQVANNGLKPASKVRVIAMYTDASVTVPPLPNDFWSTTFPAGSTSCGPLNTSTGWHLPDPAHACETIAVVNPEYPRTAKFTWNVSATQAQHTCMLVVVESADDPIPTSVRTSNIVQSWQLVPANHQIAQRNLYIVDSSAPGAPAGGMQGMGVPNMSREQIVQLVFDRSGLPSAGNLSVFLPSGVVTSALGFKMSKLATPPAVDPETAAYAAKYKIDLTTEYVVALPVASLSDLVPMNTTGGIVLNYSSGPIAPDTAARFTIFQKQGATVTGGSTFVLRSRALNTP